MEKTSVEWLVDQMKQRESQGLTLSMYELEMFAEQANKMFEKQMCEFTNNYVLTQCGASFEGNVFAEMSTEEYYELTFKTK
jgi:hypothetical protein